VVAVLERLAVTRGLPGLLPANWSRRPHILSVL
jgi:hypothetical protein